VAPTGSSNFSDLGADRNFYVIHIQMNQTNDVENAVNKGLLNYSGFSIPKFSGLIKKDKNQWASRYAANTYSTAFGCVLMRMRPEERKLVTPEGLMKLSRDRFPLTFGYTNYHHKNNINNYTSYSNDFVADIYLRNFNNTVQSSQFACKIFPDLFENLYKDRKGDFLYRGLKDTNKAIREEYKDTFYTSWTYSLQEAEGYAGKKGGSVIVLPVTESLHGINLYKIVYHHLKKIFKMNQNVFERGVKVKSGSSLGNIKELIEPTSYEIVLKPMELKLQGFLLKNAWNLPKNSQKNIKYYMAFIK
jgi:hypothetical protein